MSVVITQNPPEFQPSKSDGLYFTVSADTTNKPKFRYVFEVYVEGYKVFDGKSTPNPFGLGIIDVSRVLDSYLQNAPVSYHDETPIFSHQTSPFSRPYTNEVVDYYILVGEEYSDSFVGSITGFTGIGDQVGFPSVASNVYKSFLGTMGVNRKANLPNFNIGQFTLSGTPQPAFPYTTTNLFLTNSPRIRDISINEYYTLSFTNFDLGGAYLSEPYYVQYKFFDVNGFEIRTDQYANIISNGGGPATGCTQDYVNDYFSGGSNYNILNVGAGPKNIYQFPPQTSYYTVQLFGGAQFVQPTPTPSPTPTLTPNLTPEPTSTSTPTPTTTPSPTPSACSCINWRIKSNVGFTIQIFFVDCNGISSSFFLSPYQEFYQCACSVTANPLVTITNFGSCGGATPTPTASQTPTPSVSSTPGLSPTPTPSHSPTPSATFDPTRNVLVRDCCTSQTELQVVVSSNLFIGNTIVLSGECYQIYAYGGSGIDGNVVGVDDYINCNECVADYPCPFDPERPTPLKPSVQPNPITPSGGTQPCVSYSAVSEIFEFNVVPPCNPFENQQIMFKNRYGAWDYFMFERARAEGLGIDRQTYGQWNVAWGSSNPIKTNYSRGTTDFQTDINETHVCNSGFISQPMMVWLEELYTTNDAYLIQPDGTLFPINIVGTEFVRKTKGNKSMVNLELTFSFSNNIKLLNG